MSPGSLFCPADGRRRSLPVRRAPAAAWVSGIQSGAIASGYGGYAPGQASSQLEATAQIVPDPGECTGDPVLIQVLAEGPGPAESSNYGDGYVRGQVGELTGSGTYVAHIGDTIDFLLLLFCFYPRRLSRLVLEYLLSSGLYEDNLPRTLLARPFRHRRRRGDDLHATKAEGRSCLIGSGPSDGPSPYSVRAGTRFPTQFSTAGGATSSSAEAIRRPGKSKLRHTADEGLVAVLLKLQLRQSLVHQANRRPELSVHRCEDHPVVRELGESSPPGRPGG